MVVVNMEMMNFNFISHKDCSKNILIEIANLKTEFWHYPLEEHLHWMERNILPDDVHLLLRDKKGVLIGYLNLITLTCQIKGGVEDCIGVGNVCVGRIFQHQSLGYLIMQLAEYYLYKMKKNGMLLCKDVLASFYKKCKWVVFDGEILNIQGERQRCCLFTTSPIHSPFIIIERNF